MCILTHDPKFDVPAVQGALATDVGYIGVMGSRTTHAKRLQRLLEAGVSPDELDRLMSPIGLDLGARTPEETAISICAEIIATRTGKAAPSLKDSRARSTPDRRNHTVRGTMKPGRLVPFDAARPRRPGARTERRQAAASRSPARRRAAGP